MQYKLERISDNVYAFIQPNGDWFLSNAGVIIGKEYAIVVDSLTNEKMTRAFISEIRKITQKPIRYLINTHEHEDHLWTNHLFTGAITICHTNCRKKVIERKRMGGTNPYEKLFRLDFSGYAYTPQDMTIDKEMSIFLDDEEVRLVYVGYAHTTSDIYVYLPSQRITFAGDLLFSPPCTPFALMGNIEGYIQAIDQLASLDSDVFVPGHGEISYDRKALYESRDYLVFVRDQARKMLKEGIEDPIKAAREVNLGKYNEWISKERIVGNMARAYAELKKTSLENINEILIEMMKYRESKRV
ncbi:MAG: MBL fold metallo-hydrolase [Sulfolobales archaeon]